MDLSIVEQVALVVAVVATVRARLPKVDGWVVLVAAAVCAAGVAVAADASLLPEWGRRAIMVFFYAVGGVTVAKSAGRRIWPRDKDDKT